MKNNYVIMRDKDNKIISVNKYINDKFPIEEIKEKISEWKEDTKPELITDPKTIDILNFLHRLEDDPDQMKNLEAYENGLEEIRRIIENLT